MDNRPVDVIEILKAMVTSAEAQLRAIRKLLESMEIDQEDVPELPEVIVPPTFGGRT